MCPRSATIRGAIPLSRRAARTNESISTYVDCSIFSIYHSQDGRAAHSAYGVASASTDVGNKRFSEVPIRDLGHVIVGIGALGPDALSLASDGYSCM